MGGVVAAADSGWLQKEIASSAYEYQQAIERGELSIVGVNCFNVEEENPIEIEGATNAAEIRQAEMLWATKNHPKWTQRTRVLFGYPEGRALDSVDFETPDRGTRTIWFDITSLIRKR